MTHSRKSSSDVEDDENQLIERLLQRLRITLPAVELPSEDFDQAREDPDDAPALVRMGERNVEDTPSSP